VIAFWRIFWVFEPVIGRKWFINIIEVFQSASWLFFFLLCFSSQKEEQATRAELRLNFLQLMQQLSGRSAEIYTVEKNKVKMSRFVVYIKNEVIMPRIIFKIKKKVKMPRIIFKIMNKVKMPRVIWSVKNWVCVRSRFSAKLRGRNCCQTNILPDF
jgi:hypothetical protein